MISRQVALTTPQIPHRADNNKKEEDQEEKRSLWHMDNGGENNGALPLAGGESHFMLDLRRNLPSKLYRVGFATSATAVGGSVQQLVAAASSRSRQAEADVPLSPLPLFLLLVTLFGAMGTIYTGRRLEVDPAPTPRWRKAGVAIYFFCLLLLVAAASLVGSDYCELALNFMDN